MINWKLRFQNKTTLTTLIVGIIAVIYQILDLLGIIPKFDQSAIVNIAMMIIDLLCIVGIVVDPTTKGISDSTRALGYTEPHDDASN